jgi:putative transcriptional regulator
MGKGGGRISNQIRELRFHQGEMTQQALADLVGVTRQTVNAIEGNKYSPSLEVAFRIARVFGVPLERVFQSETEGKWVAGDLGMLSPFRRLN